LSIFSVSPGCSVYNVDAIPRKVNVALKRPAWQSSLMIWSGVPYPAYKATDGSMETNHYVQPSCAHTLIELNPWLAIDLGVPIYVNGVDVTSRGDCNHCGAYAEFLLYNAKKEVDSSTFRV